MIKNLKPRLAEAGKIKIGCKGKTITSRGGKQFQPPQKLDHFLITTTRRGEDGNLTHDTTAMQACQADSDGKIRAISIVLHSDGIDDVFPTRYVLYEGRKMTCSGDGEKNDKDGTCPCDRLNATQGQRCKPNGNLHCSIVIPGCATAGAVHMWRTTSIISIERMIGSLNQILELFGTLRGVPLTLVVAPVSVSPQGRATTVYCCHVECREADVQAIQERALRAAEMRRALGSGDTGAYRALLQTPGVGEDLTEQAEVADEYYPDATVDAQLVDSEPETSQAARLTAQLATTDPAPERPAEPEPEPKPKPKPKPKPEKPGPSNEPPPWTDFTPQAADDADDADQLITDIGKAQDLDKSFVDRCIDIADRFPGRKKEIESAWRKRSKELKRSK